MRGGRQLTTPALARGMRAFNDVLRTEGRAHGALVVDLSEMDGDLDAFFDDCHFTESGAREVARRVGEALRTELALDGAAPSATVEAAGSRR